MFQTLEQLLSFWLNGGNWISFVDDLLVGGCEEKALVLLEKIEGSVDEDL